MNEGDGDDYDDDDNAAVTDVELSGCLTRFGQEWGQIKQFKWEINTWEWGDLYVMCVFFAG